jgi:WD40 repeat protein
MASPEIADRVGQQRQPAAHQIVGPQKWTSLGHLVSTITSRHNDIEPSTQCHFQLLHRHAHKSTVMDLKWNDNGNWLVTASRDHLLKLFDLRNLKEEFQVFRGHKKEASAVSWHPVHEGLFASGGSDGSILFWNVG